MIEQASLERVLLAVIMGAIVAAVANALVFTFATIILGDDFLAPALGDPSRLVRADIMPVIFVTFAAVMAGGGVLVMLNQFTARPATYFVVVALGVLLVSLPFPFLPSDPSLPDATITVFLIMHVVGAVTGVGTMLQIAYGASSEPLDDEAI